nr:hypothetical protein [Rhodococcus sp. USK13]
MTKSAGTVIQAVSGAAQIGFHVITTKLLRHWRTTWGATDAEAVTPLPGDELVPNTRWGYTHAVTIAAPPDQVWPWIIQLGQGRGGFYSYEGLETLIGCRIRNTNRVLPDCQHLEVGDGIRLHPKAPPLKVAVVEPPSALVLHGSNPETGDSSIWAFHVLQVDDGHSRLIERGRSTYGSTLSSRLAFGPTLIEPVAFVMSRRMLLTIRNLAEGG